MKLTMPVLAFVIAVFTFAGGPLRQLSAMRADPLPAQESGRIEDSMQVLQASTKRIEKALQKDDLVTVADVVLRMQSAVWEAKTKEPEKGSAITDATEKAAFLLAFRKELIQLEKHLLDLELAALDGKVDDAKRVFEQNIKPMKKAGHARYKD
jgi:hypothetical protein